MTSSSAKRGTEPLAPALPVLSPLRPKAALSKWLSTTCVFWKGDWWSSLYRSERRTKSPLATERALEQASWRSAARRRNDKLLSNIQTIGIAQVVGGDDGVNRGIEALRDSHQRVARLNRVDFTPRRRFNRRLFGRGDITR